MAFDCVVTMMCWPLTFVLRDEIADKLELDHVVKHQQPVRLLVEPALDRIHHQLLLLRVGFLQPELLSEQAEVGVERVLIFGAHPEHRGILLAMQAGVFGGGLRLAHPAHAGERRYAALLQRLFQFGELVAALSEEGVVGEWGR